MNQMNNRKLRIVYCTPSLYIAGGVERVLTSKANYLAEQDGAYEVTFILTDGRGKEPFYPLSDKVKVINLGIDFEELWHASFFRKIIIYLRKQRQYKRMLRKELMRLRPDITISTLRREVNFITRIPDGSKKIGELHINRQNYRNFGAHETNFVKRLFSKVWMRNLVGHLRQLDCLVVLTEQDKLSWRELDHVKVIPDPLTIQPSAVSRQTEKRMLAVGRYSHEKGFDLLLKAWNIVEKSCPDWRLDVFGDGDTSSYEQQIIDLAIDRSRCELHGRTQQVETEYVNSSVFVCSSRFEGFGMVLVESMACGLPVVSFDCPWGPRSIIDHEKNGLLVPNGDVNALAAQLIRVAKDADLRHSLAAEAVKKAKMYDMNVVGQQWKKLFDELA